jgi:fructokinase
MIVVVGEILIDRFPDDERIGGAPFNFAFHLHRMGWPVRFLTRIGDDARGRRVLETLKKSGLGTAGVQIDTHHPTGLVDVVLDSQGIPQFEICEEVAYDYLDLSKSPDSAAPGAELIYFGTLIQRTDNGHRQVQTFLDRIQPTTCRFCDINLRPPHINPNAVQSSLRHSDILKLNTQELLRISAMLGGPNDEADAAAWLLQTFAPSQIALTMGSNGSKTITVDRTITSPPIQVEAIVDTVGAGDAYAAVYAAGYLKAAALDQTLALATAFAADICRFPGAIPEGIAPYKHLRQKMGP